MARQVATFLDDMVERNNAAAIEVLLHHPDLIVRADTNGHIYRPGFIVRTAYTDTGIAEVFFLRKEKLKTLLTACQSQAFVHGSDIDLGIIIVASEFISDEAFN